MGIPSITVRNKAIGYYFGSDDCLFYEPGNVQSLRAILDRLTADPESLRRYQQRAVILRQKFTWSGEKQKYIALLRELAGYSGRESRAALQHGL
jgi:hypothetical protein